MAKDKQRTLCREHIDSNTRLCSKLLTPNTTSIYGNCSTVLALLAINGVYSLYAHYPAALDNQLLYLCVGEHLCTVQTRIENICSSKSKWINRAIRHLYSTNEGRIYRWFEGKRQLRVDSLGRDTCREARLDKLRLKLETILRKGDKEATRILYAVRGDTTQNHILLYTLLGALAVIYSVARTRVQQAVIASRSTGSNVVPLDKQRTDSAQRTVTRHTGTRCSATDNNYIKFIHCIVVCLFTPFKAIHATKLQQKQTP